MNDELLNINEEMLLQSQEYEVFLMNIEASIIFRGKDLQTWESEISLPVIRNSSELSPQEIEVLNQTVLNKTEVIMANLAIAKSVHIAAQTNQDIAMIKARERLSAQFALEGRKDPAAAAFEKLCLSECEKTYVLLQHATLILEFWNAHSYKLMRADDRLRSLSIAKRM